MLSGNEWFLSSPTSNGQVENSQARSSHGYVLNQLESKCITDPVRPLDLYLKSLPDTQRQSCIFAPALEKPETWECSHVEGEKRFQDIKMGPQKPYYKLALLKQIIFSLL